MKREDGVLLDTYSSGMVTVEVRVHVEEDGFLRTARWFQGDAFSHASLLSPAAQEKLRVFLNERAGR